MKVGLKIGLILVSVGLLPYFAPICAAASPADIRQLKKKNECQRCDLSHSKWRDADLNNAVLDLSILTSADFSSADLNSAKLASVNLSGALLENANLSNANLDRALLTGVNAVGINLS